MNLHPKVKASGVAGAVSILLIFFLNTVGIEVPAEVAAALTTVLSTVAGYLKV